MTPKSSDVTTKDVKYVLEVNAGEGKTLLGVVGKPCSSLQKILDEEHEEHEDYQEEKGEHKEHHKEEGEGHHGGANIIIKIITVPEGMNKKFKKGGRIDLIEDDVKADYSRMQVLDDAGKVLMNITGGERIFSIPHTEKLVSLAGKVKRGEIEPEQLGKEVKKILHIQDTQDPQYV